MITNSQFPQLKQILNWPNNHNRWLKILMVVVFIFLVILVVILTIITQEQSLARERINLLASELDLIKTQFNQNQEVLTALVDGNSELATSLQLEQTTRLAAEVEAEASRKQLLALEKEVTTQKVALEASDITKVIREWSPRVVRLTCETELSEGGSRVAKASAVADLTSGELRFMTNKHVVEEKGVMADECELTLKDLNAVSESFVRSLSGMFHQRIEYPESIEEAHSKEGIFEGLYTKSPEGKGESEADKGADKEDTKKYWIS